MDSREAAWTPLGRALVERAPRHGFVLAGVLDLEATREVLSGHADRFDRWLADGFGGDMSYLKTGREARRDPSRLDERAKGILCVALPYGPGEARESGENARYARYLRGRDYHRVAAEHLEALLADARRDFDFEWSVAVDTRPILERSWAYFAGLGWIGKNTCLIHPRHGSYLFLAEALLSVSPGGAPRPMRDHCGSCERCLVACPTGAFVASRTLDARRCVAYWTLEQRRGFAPPASPESIEGMVAGCDICQAVCPFNDKVRNDIPHEFADEASDATRTTDWETLLGESTRSYRRRTRDSALSWVRPAHFRRNVAHALASVAERLDPARRPRLVELASRLREEDGDASVRDALDACLARLRGDQAPK